MAYKMNLNYLKNLFFVFIQFNSFNLFVIQQYAYNKNVFDYKYYLESNDFVQNLVNSQYKIETNLKVEVSKRKVFIDSFIFGISTIILTKIFFQDKIISFKNRYLENQLFFTLIPRAPPHF